MSDHRQTSDSYLQDRSQDLPLSERQATVLRALVGAYVGRAGPVASSALSELMPTSLSSASIRNTLAELHEKGLIAKAHASAGRVPTVTGMRLFVDRLLELGELGPHHQRLLDREFDGVDAAEAPRQASHVLSEHTRQLGFVLAPRIDRLRLRSVHLIPVAERRILAILVAENGRVIERLIDDPAATGSTASVRELEQVRALLAERVEGRTLIALGQLIEKESETLRDRADRYLRRAWAVGLKTCEANTGPAEDDLVISGHLALLDQPEFSDPNRIRGLFEALETSERLLELVRRIASASEAKIGAGLALSLGVELGVPSLRDCALVVVPCGPTGTTISSEGSEAAMGAQAAPASGALGVIGPQRMDYGRVIPLVQYCSELVTRKLLA